MHPHVVGGPEWGDDGFLTHEKRATWGLDDLLGPAMHLAQQCDGVEKKGWWIQISFLAVSTCKTTLFWFPSPICRTMISNDFIHFQGLARIHQPLWVSDFEKNASLSRPQGHWSAWKCEWKARRLTFTKLFLQLRQLSRSRSKFQALGWLTGC
jgi:hypothetical protein